MRLLLLISMLVSGLASADSAITIQGLYPDRAVIKLGRSLQILKVGEKSPIPGVQLVSANSEQAVISINGQEKSFVLGRSVGGYDARVEKKVVIKRDTHGMYRYPGFINGKRVRLLIDTGATLVAMSEVQAKQLGLDYLQGQRGHVTTASDKTAAFAVTLKRVKVGEIELNNVSAMVLEGAYPKEVLLGMSFLKETDMQDNGQTLKLTKKW